MGLIDVHCTDAITITAKGTRLVDGRYADGTSVSTTARVVHKSGMRIDSSKKEYLYSMIIYMKASESIDLQTKVTVDGTIYRIKDIREVDAIGGTRDHYKVWCG